MKPLTPAQREEMLKEKGYIDSIIEVVQAGTPKQADAWVNFLLTMSAQQVAMINKMETIFIQLGRK